MSRIHRIITNDSKKAFDKAQHSFLIKVLEALGIDRKYLKIINTIYNKFIASTVLNVNKAGAFPLKAGTDWGDCSPIS